MRKIKVDGQNYQIRPSFILPYCRAKTDVASKGFFLKRFGVPFWALAFIFGHNSMWWYRLYNSLSDYSIVGTTVHNGEKLPLDILADEHHIKIRGKKAYVATTVGQNCFLGMEVSSGADADSLEDSYNVFKQEAKDLSTDYEPNTVNTDGWAATQNAWQGEGKSLDIINDGENNKPTLAKTGNYSGQAWKLTPLGKGFYRLTPAWQGEGKSLNIINDGENNKPILANTGNYSGQSWKITSLTSSSKPTANTNTRPIDNRRGTTRQKPTPKPKPATKTRTATKPKPTSNTKTSSNTNAPKSVTEQMENDIMKMVNDHRQKMGLNPLQFDPIVRRYSREHSVYMKAQGRISHDDFQGRVVKLSSEVGSTSMEGENVAMNSSAKGAFEAWMNSSGHRTNIEKPAFTHAALGVVEKSNGMYYLTHIFIAKR